MQNLIQTKDIATVQRGQCKMIVQTAPRRRQNKNTTAKTRKQKHHNKKTQWHYHKETSPEETTTDVKTLWKRFIIVIFHSLPS